MKTEKHPLEMRAVCRMELVAAEPVQINGARVPRDFIITKLHITTWWHVSGEAMAQQNVAMEGHFLGRKSEGRVYRYQLANVPEWLQELITDGTPMGLTIRETK